MRKTLGMAAALVVTTTMAAHAETVVLSMPESAGNWFWSAVEQGARGKATALGADLVVLPMAAQYDAARQIAEVTNQLAQSVDGLAIVPSDAQALAPTINQARQNGVGVVFIATMGANDGVPFIGSDDHEGGLIGGSFFCGGQAPGGTEVAILQGSTHPAAEKRADGARAVFERCSLSIVADQPGDQTPGPGQSRMQKILGDHPNLTGVFAPDDRLALEAVQELRAANALDRVKVVGFGGTPEAIASIAAGEMAATVSEGPNEIGAQGVEIALRVKRGENVPPKTNTNVLVTEDSVADFQ